MHTITFICETITPLFLSGADSVTPELRAPSIKGALRFWWRAINGHLNLKTLKERENAIFGGVDGSGRSKVIVRIAPKEVRTGTETLVPHKDFMRQKAFLANETTFEVTLGLVYETDIFTLQHLHSLFVIATTLGGFGKRSRRGMGSISILNHPQPKELGGIFELLQVFSPYFVMHKDVILFSFSGRTEAYPWVRQIRLGKPESDFRKTIRKISFATHKVHSERPQEYEASIGTARGGRLASCIYASTIKGSSIPIVTKLNLAPNKNMHKISLFVQEELINAIIE